MDRHLVDAEYALDDKDEVDFVSATHSQSDPFVTFSAQSGPQSHLSNGVELRAMSGHLWYVYASPHFGYRFV
mgnify:CR=1 FL=1